MRFRVILIVSVIIVGFISKETERALCAANHSCCTSFFAVGSKLSTRTLETFKSHVTPLDRLTVKCYLETNSALEIAWPRLETCLTSRAIEREGRTSFYLNIAPLQHPFNPVRFKLWLARYLLNSKWYLPLTLYFSFCFHFGSFLLYPSEMFKAVLYTAMSLLQFSYQINNVLL